jgi:magnesium-transporting ATPase (P-type)
MHVIDSRRPGQDGKTFWSSSPESLLAALGSLREGLTGNEAEFRLQSHGLNSIRPKRRASTVSLFAAQFKSETDSPGQPAGHITDRNLKAVLPRFPESLEYPGARFDCFRVVLLQALFIEVQQS